jgi:HEAT repeat protein
MGSIFEFIRRLGPAGIVFKAVLAALIGDALLLIVILVRRTYRRRYFARRDARVFYFRTRWNELIAGQIPYEQWRTSAFDRRIVEALALESLESAPPAEAARLLEFLRTSGLLQKRIYEAQKHHGWRRRRALVALGRTRAPEGIPALAGGLRDRNLETQLAALRGLGRTCLPEAAEEILQWVGEVGLVVPKLPLENALINCSRERPRMLLPYLAGAEGPVREILARVLGEVATAALETDLVRLAGDADAELRASAARALAHAKSTLALPVLATLVDDAVWFVRLRAVVALGQLRTVQAISALVHALTDSHRLVRFRAAQALVEQEEELATVFERVVETADRYGLDAYITAAENAGVYTSLLEELRGAEGMEPSRRERLLQAASRRLWPEAPEETPVALAEAETAVR